MDFLPNTKQVARAPQPAGESSQSVVTAPKPKSKSKKLAVVVVALVVIAVLAAGAWWLLSSRSTDITAVKKDAYQAVFLTNGQVYFGKISGSLSDGLVLKDIYYLQQQTAQPSSNTKDAKATSSPDQKTQLSLAKLGNELHGPEDVMYISKKQVLFWENLKADGKVSQAIKQYKP